MAIFRAYVSAAALISCSRQFGVSSGFRKGLGLRHLRFSPICGLPMSSKTFCPCSLFGRQSHSSSVADQIKAANLSENSEEKRKARKTSNFKKKSAEPENRSTSSSSSILIKKKSAVSTNPLSVKIEKTHPSAGKLEALDSQERSHIKKTVFSARPSATFVYQRPILPTSADKQPPKILPVDVTGQRVRKAKKSGKGSVSTAKIYSAQKSAPLPSKAVTDGAPVTEVPAALPKSRSQIFYETLTEKRKLLEKVKILDKRKKVEKRASLNVKALLEELKQKQDKKSQSMYQQNFYAKLCAYLHACILSDQVNRAYDTLRYYCERSGVGFRLRKKEVKTPEAFNIVLEGFARAGNPSKAHRVLEWMKREKVSANMNTVSAVCLMDSSLKGACEEKSLKGRRGKIGARMDVETASSKHIKASDVILEVLDLAKVEGLEIQKVFQNRYYCEEDKATIFRSLESMVPDFQAADSQPLQDSYGKHLLKGLEELPANYFESPYKGLFTKEKLEELFYKQLEAEKNDSIQIPSAFIINNKGSKEALNAERFDRLKLMWKDSLTAGFIKFREAIELKSMRRDVSLGPFFSLLKPAEYAELMLNEVLALCEELSEGYSNPVAWYYYQLGRRVMHTVHMKIKEKQGFPQTLKKVYGKYAELFLDEGELLFKNHRMNHRLWWLKSAETVANLEDRTFDLNLPVWPGDLQKDVGRTLYDIIFSEVKIWDNISKSDDPKTLMAPAFMTVFRTESTGKERLHIVPRPVLERMVWNVPQLHLSFESKLLPMLCPPFPWINDKRGGFLLGDSDLIRFMPEFRHWMFNQVKERSEFPQYMATLDSLNQLGSTPWIINQQILDVILEVFGNKGAPELDIPSPSDTLPPPPKISPSTPHSESRQLYIKRYELTKARREMHSLWCTALYKLSIANYFRNSVIWFPHNMDFRGRVYPTPPLFNHMGDDVSRSLLKFAKGQPLGPNGLDWLKIHCINLTGTMKKASLKERLQFCNDILDVVIDSAENPLHGKCWWKESDEPWQTLACCSEISEAIKSGNPESFVSHLPVHQDGSCNGLQHYAALGRDVAGGKNVNVSPSERPQDVYTEVAKRVEELRQIHAVQGHPMKPWVKKAALEIGPEVIQRKVVKQTVMTVVYGVTSYGARLQIRRQLKDMDLVSKEQLSPSSSYIAFATFESLGVLAKGARDIQAWLTDMAALISSQTFQTVEWVTPLGLPVVQPYMRSTTFASLKTKDDLRGSVDVAETRKQKNAFPPNFVHSLDSTHMMMTSLHCQHQGITYSSVHDCFWTHANTVERMNRICREQFVALHKENILGDLRDFVLKTYMPILEKYAVPDLHDFVKKRFEAVPKKGDLDIEDVLKSTYFFS